MTEKMTSEELASRAATGDAEAFRALLRLHYDRVFRVVFSVVKNQSDAEDITQDIWAAMPGKLRNWRGEAKLTSWLHRIAVNAAKDALRKSATRSRTTAGYIEVDALERAAISIGNAFSRFTGNCSVDPRRTDELRRSGGGTWRS